MHTTLPAIQKAHDQLVPAKPVARVSALPGRAQCDVALMNRIVIHRDAPAFSELTRHYAPRLKAWLMHRGESGATAEDIVQDVMVKVWHKAELYDCSKASFSTWVYRLTRNRWIDHKRKHDRLQPTAPDIMASLADRPVSSAESDVELVERAEAIQMALATLPNEQKEMLHMSFFEGLTHREISKRTGIALGTVKSRIRVPLQRLRAQLQDFRIEED